MQGLQQKAQGLNPRWQGGNGSLSTSMGGPAQKPETKKNSVFQFLSKVTKDLISL